MKQRLALVEQLKRRGIRDDRLLEAILAIPRENFVPRFQKPRAYEDRPLPIGKGQTISQAYVAALMTSLLELSPSDRVLEIGTGSGYQTAILAHLAEHVYTVEVFDELSSHAKKRLHALGLSNISFRVGDGREGWPEHAHYNGIIVTAAAAEISDAWKEQLEEGGRLVVPVGEPYSEQILQRLWKSGGQFRAENHGYVRFVPLL